MYFITAGTFSKALSQEYFQQEVNYKINVTLNDRLHELSAFETVMYINNSRDTLRFLYFHLWPNGYANNKTALGRELLRENGKEKLFNDPELEGHIDSLDFRVKGEKIQWNRLEGEPDICRIIPGKPICPGDTMILTTPFHVKIPKGVTSRLGHIGESYQVSQWYPKPAVYDRSGWHQIPYLDQGEFYSEFGSFDVSITLPANYIVGATGNLQNKEETEMLDRLAADTDWLRTLFLSSDKFPVSSAQMKTLRYTGTHIHDFAWFADKRFHVMKGKVRLPASGREVTTWVMFTNQQAVLWLSAIQYVNSAISQFSNWIGDYPYDSFTAVQGALASGSGMEYPGITVIGHAEDDYQLDLVIAHEVCHSWFYSALGSDERRYPFMDEGTVSAYENRYANENYPGKKLWEVYFKNRKLAKFFHIDKMPVNMNQEVEWFIQARSNLEQPINLPAPDYNELNYSLIVYDKTAMCFNYLRAYLGDPVFDSVMHDYYRIWKSKHPQPEDLRKVFETHTGKDLSWFFTDFIGTNKRLDYKVIGLRNRQLLVQNNGELVSPFIICGMTGDSVFFKKWSEGFEGRRWIDIPPGNYSEIKIDPSHVMPEVNRLNNNIKVSGIFRKSDPLLIQFLYTIDDPDKRTLIYVPVLNWTKENGIMAGALLQNRLLLPKPVEFTLLPFYTFNKPGLAGSGKISFNITPYDNFIRMATITLEGTEFGAPGLRNYRKARVGLDLFFRNIKMNDPLNQKIFGYFYSVTDLSLIELGEKPGMSSFIQFGYSLEKERLIDPFSLLAAFESGKSYQKASLEINYKLSYYGKNRGLDIRLFAGTMLENSSEVPFYDFSPGGRGGRELYLYQGTYPSRFSIFPTSFWSRQMTVSEGGLASPVNDSLGYSRWLISLSFTSNLPGKTGMIPVKPFFNILLNDHGSLRGNDSPVYLEAGLKAGIWNFFEIWVPFLVSRNVGTIVGPVKERIRFVFNLNALNKLKIFH